MLKTVYCSSLQYMWYNKSLPVLNKPQFIPVYRQICSSTCRPMCSKVELHHNKAILDTQTVFKEIYRFPAIRFGFVLHKLKWTQTVCMAAAVPSSVLLCLAGIIDCQWITSIAVPGFVITLNFYAFAELFHKAIGFMYVSEDNKTFKVSFLDFWGNRVDEECAVGNVMTFSDAPPLLTDRFFKQVMFFSSDKLKLKLFINSGKITDKDKFLKVFGTDSLN